MICQQAGKINMGIELKLKHRQCRMHLILEHKITVIVGLSGTGKSTLHRALTDKDATTQFKISDTKYQVEYIPNRQFADHLMNEDGIFTGYKIYLIDEGRLEIDNDIANAIQHSVYSYFVITSRTNLGRLNFDMHAVKELEIRNNGITVLKDYVMSDEKTESEWRNIKIESVIVEDSGKAKKWFGELLKNLSVRVESPEKMGKEQVCQELLNKLDHTSGIILSLFDECSFGCCIKEFKGRI